MSERIQTSTIIDFAHGRLTPEESLGLLKSIEEDPERPKNSTWSWT